MDRTDLRQAAGQMLVAGFDGHELPHYVADDLAHGRLGGVVLFARNVGEVEQVVALNTAIQDAVGQLSPEIRAAFLLREYHGLDYAEIARMLELEMGTVKSRLSRARASLRRALGEIHSLHPEHDDHG